MFVNQKDGIREVRKRILELFRIVIEEEAPGTDTGDNEDDDDAQDVDLLFPFPSCSTQQRCLLYVPISVRWLALYPFKSPWNELFILFISTFLQT